MNWRLLHFVRNDKTLHDKALRTKLTEGGNVLVIQTAFLGDVILLTPLLRALKYHFPKVSITTLTLPECAPFVASFVNITEVIDKKDAAALTEHWKALKDKLCKTAFDVAFIPHRSLRSALFAHSLGIHDRIGFSRGIGQMFHTTTVPYRSVYEGIRNLDLLSPIFGIDATRYGCSEDHCRPELIPSMLDFQVIDGLYRELSVLPRRYAVFAPGSVWTTKCWAATSYRALAKMILENHQLPVLAVGGKADEALCADIVLKPEYNLAGRLTLMQSAALIKGSAFLVSGDSAPAHIATAVGARQIVIFGSTSPRYGFAPPFNSAKIIETDLWCRPCTDHGRKVCPLGHFNCLNRITPAQVYKRLQEWN